ncbi:MAG TPA: nucleotide exchange factor GrpE [Chromatiaceae bacterium]|jgi:molecular chaperone GrpE|nr:nucleotide exchange factor GrpE [Chromatiaceae bacterium]HIA07640.1 nucleotide exchange factor GrpE [Chromatiaceae bacterium]HIN81525.1 nucleotide exchange factor GrpE [Chromatiales bacterium]HIO53657.1 nucleotide exchange factor GrpE [Chromatiales bacterium]
MTKETDVNDETPVEDEQIVELVSDNGDASSGDPADLHLLLEDARAKADDHWDQLLRTQADMDNLRRRNERDLENAHKFALERFVQDLLPIWDSLEMALAAAEGDDADIAHLREGSELTLKLMQTAMEKHAVKRVNPEGEAFDPELHQAMSMQVVEGVAANQVINVVQQGVSLNGRLVRPAMVIVSKAGESSTVDEQS